MAFQEAPSLSNKQRISASSQYPAATCKAVSPSLLVSFMSATSFNVVLTAAESLLKMTFYKRDNPAGERSAF